MKGLTEAEGATLNALGADLVNSLAQRLLVRLHPLMPEGTPLPPPVKPVELFVGGEEVTTTNPNSNPNPNRNPGDNPTLILALTLTLTLNLTLTLALTLTLTQATT